MDGFTVLDGIIQLNGSVLVGLRYKGFSYNLYSTKFRRIFEEASISDYILVMNIHQVIRNYAKLF